MENTLCSYIAIKEPKVREVSFLNMIELVGLLPAKTLCGSNFSSASPDNPCLTNSSLAFKL